MGPSECAGARRDMPCPPPSPSPGHILLDAWYLDLTPCRAEPDFWAISRPIAPSEHGCARHVRATLRRWPPGGAILGVGVGGMPKSTTTETLSVPERGRLPRPCSPAATHAQPARRRTLAIRIAIVVGLPGICVPRAAVRTAGPERQAGDLFSAGRLRAVHPAVLPESCPNGASDRDPEPGRDRLEPNNAPGRIGATGSSSSPGPEGPSTRVPLACRTGARTRGSRQYWHSQAADAARDCDRSR